MPIDTKSDDGAWVTDDGLWDRLQQLRNQLRHDIEQANRGLLEELKQSILVDTTFTLNSRSPASSDGFGAGKPRSSPKNRMLLVSESPQGMPQRQSVSSAISASVSQLKQRVRSPNVATGRGDFGAAEMQVLPSQVPPAENMNDPLSRCDAKVSFDDEDDIVTISALNSMDEERQPMSQVSVHEGWTSDGAGPEHSTSRPTNRQTLQAPPKPPPPKTASFLGRLGAVPPDIEAEMESQQKKANDPPWLVFLAHVVRSPFFDAFFGMLIVLNSITIGFQTDHMAREVTEVVPVPYMVMDKMFCAMFTIELSLRLVAFRQEFFKASGVLWGIFDICVIGLQLTEEIILLVAAASSDDDGSSGGGTNMSFMRVMRILRLIRVLRIIRIIRFMDELRTLVISIMNSMRSLFWTLALLLLGIYVVGIYFTQLSLELRLQSPDPSEVNLYFGVLSRSMLTLYGAMSGGIDWDTLCTPLVEDISPLQGVVFALYIAFTVLALTNVVTGVFVEGALKSAKQEEERNMYETLQQMFFLADDKNEGLLSTEQFKSRLESSDMNRYLQSIDINPSEAHLLFELIDSDGSGNVDYAEFVGGCMRIRGAAKAIDVILLLHEVLALRKTLDSYIEASKTRMNVSKVGPTHTVSSTLKTAKTISFNG